MAFLRASLVVLCAVTTTVLAAPSIRATPPAVTLDKGTFIGTSADGVNRFLGIPFAQPPVGDLRFRLPQALGSYSGIHNATTFGLSCTQQAAKLALPNGLPQETIEALTIETGGPIPDSEDCLTLNVVTPAQASPGSRLPVVVWIYGGGFEVGSTTTYDGGIIVNRSLALNKPVIYVSMNYRVSAFGFLASQEVKDAGVGNLGLQDREHSTVSTLDVLTSGFTERMALRWVQKYIYAFGGDPSKVTIWGESAGSMSVSLHMLVNGGDTEGLFRAAFMESGSPLSVGDITHGQQYYDDIVELTGCSGSSDTLACLRAAPYDKLRVAMDSTPSIFSYQVRGLPPTDRPNVVAAKNHPQSLALAWQPRVDGVFLVDDPQKLVQQGKVARIHSSQETAMMKELCFPFPKSTTDAELRDYLSEFFLIGISDAQMDEVLTFYPQNVTLGSPYGTGTQNAFTPEFKRIASILGDLIFQAPRRFFLNHSSDKQNTWSFLSKRLKSLPILGSLHSSDILDIYGPGDLTDYLIHFATNLDPNGGASAQWPQYMTSSRKLLTLLDDPVTNITVTQDTYRTDGMEFLTKLSLAHPL
ncbi:carotenoid ester lipase precursor [Lactarius quietus]|nr:carotenoid ester lipase precursor [Lactarius quietus]